MQVLTKNPSKPQRHYAKLFGWLLLLTFFFMLFQAAYVIGNAHVYFGNFRLVAAHVHLPWRVLLGIAGFGMAQLLVHFAWTFLVFLLAVGSGRALRLSLLRTEVLACLLWLSVAFLVFFLNIYLFPNSSFSKIIMPRLSFQVIMAAMALSAALPLVAFVVSVSWLVLSWPRVSATVLLLAAGIFFVGRPVPMAGVSTAEKPDIILVGIDSLRPDHLSINGSALKTPHLDDFIDGAVSFSQSLTPIARTYPAWVSILTGRYPVNSGIRTNLQNTAGQDFSQTLPAVLQKKGYQTVFATDESAFSNIDAHYGFDQVITPPQGLNDFLMSRLNDFPLSNVLANTAIGRVLFPWSYANRAAYSLYQPDTFLARLRRELSRPRSKPLFLAVHFCLPHYPYMWSSMPAARKIADRQYSASIQRMDSQFSDFMTLLRNNHLLDHALVVLLSDHGEALEMPGDRITEADLFVGRKPLPHFYPPSITHEKVNMSGGHGTDVLGLPQYHTVLAFRPYGLFPVSPRVVSGMVSLLDIQPTLYAYLGIRQPSDGVSLLGVLQGNDLRLSQNRNFFVESDFSPRAIRSVHPDEHQLLFEGYHFFRIDPSTTKVVVRDDMLQLILSSKQFANYKGEWVLAVYPQSGRRARTILVNLRTGEWTDNLSLAFAGRSPAASMLRDLKDFFHLKNLLFMH